MNTQLCNLFTSIMAALAVLIALRSVESGNGMNPFVFCNVNFISIPLEPDLKQRFID